MALIVHPISATINKGYDFFLIKRNPYLICTVGIEKQVTNAHLAGGKQPKWKDTLLFNAKAAEMKILLCDKAILREDNVLGWGNVSLTSIYSNPQRPQIKFVDIVKDGQAVAKVQMSIQYMPAPSLSKDNEIKLAIFKDQNKNKQDEQYKRVSGLLSNHLVSLVGNVSKSDGDRSNSIIEQPNIRMAMSSVRNNNPVWIQERNCKGHRRNNSLSNSNNQQYEPWKAPQNNHTIENNSHILIKQVLETETNPLKIIQRVSLNNMSNVMMSSLRNQKENLGEMQNKMRTEEQPQVFELDGTNTSSFKKSAYNQNTGKPTY